MASVLRILVAFVTSNLLDLEVSLVGSRVEHRVGDLVSFVYGLGFVDSVVSSLGIFLESFGGSRSNLHDGSMLSEPSFVGRRVAEPAVDRVSFLGGLGSHDSVVRSLGIIEVVF